MNSQISIVFVVGLMFCGVCFGAPDVGKCKSAVDETKIESPGNDENADVLDEPLTIENLEKRNREMDLRRQQLMAEIEKDSAEFQKYPRRFFVGARVRNPVIAKYLDMVLKKIERTGTDEYPERLSQKKLYGRVLLTFQIDSNGDLNLVEIISSGGEKLLAEEAVMLIRKSSPFPKFSPALSKITDLLVITRSLTFTSTSDEVVKEAWLINHPCEEVAPSAKQVR